MQQPVIPLHNVEYLGRRMLVWRRNHINDSNACKLMRFWLGYEFRHLMDGQGRIAVMNISHCSKQLGYKVSVKFLEQIKHSRSFLLVNDTDGKLLFVASPVWYKYDPKDGVLDAASLKNADGNLGGNLGGIYEDKYMNINPTGGNAEAFSSGEEQTGGMAAALMTEEEKALFRQRYSDVRKYFRWLLAQKDADHAGLVGDIVYRLQNPLARDGKVMKEKTVGEAEAREMLKILLLEVMPQYFAKREQFFRHDYVGHPEKRIWWMKNFFRNHASSYYSQARRKWESCRKAQLSKAYEQQQQQIEQHRPISPHEWQNPETLLRFYRYDGSVRQIPEAAPPRPDEDSYWNKFNNNWKK